MYLSMKKYLMISAAALSFCGLFTSCTHDLDDSGYSSAAEKSVINTYKEAFVTAFGQPAPTQTWGFGPTSVAGVRGGTRTVPGIEFPDEFSDKTNITEPNKNNFGKPSITQNDATVSTGSYNEWPSINAGSTVYLEENAVLKLYDKNNPNNSISLQNVNLYMSKGSRLEVPTGLYISGTTKLVNDEGTIVIGSDDNKKNIWSDNFTGIFWNNGSIEGIQDIGTSNDGGTFYFGSKTSFTANNISLNKIVKFWNEGEITLNGKFEAKEYGHEIYNSGTIITPKIILPQKTVLWNEGTITAANSKEIDFSVSNPKVQIYNGTDATLKLETLTFNNNQQLVVNEGTLNVKGKITIPNNSEIVNYSKLTGGSFEMLSGAKFYNVAGGEVTIDGLSKITNDGSGNNKDNVWMNSGQYTTGSFEATGGCQNPAAFNNCHMYVTNKFFMNHSNFVLDGGAAVECGSFEWKDDNYFHMGGKALLKVTGQLLANNNDTGYGFYGDDTEYAVIQAGSVTKGTDSPKFAAAYFGNIFVDTNNHFPQGELNAQGTYYTFGDNVKFSFTDNTDVSGFQTQGAKTAKKDPNFSITIPADPNGCTPGYKYGDDDDESDPGVVRIICEDLSAKNEANGNSDWDFNDVVFDVKLIDNNTRVKIKLLAAGGTLPLTVAGHEVHEEFAEANPTANISTGTMINTKNTGAKYTLRGLTPGYIYADIQPKWRAEEGELGLLKSVAKNIPVQVHKLVGNEKKWVTMECIQGEPAAKIAVGTDYNWCDERTDIRNNFKASTPGGAEVSTFKMFVKDKLSATEWYNTKEVTIDDVQEFLISE